MAIEIPVTIKRHAPLIVGALAGLALVYYWVRGKSTAVAAPSAVPQFIVQPAPTDTTPPAPAAGSADATSYIKAITQLVAATGQSAAAAYETEAELPATAINAAANQNQIALSSAAGVAAAGIQATPDYLNAVANLATASYLPFASYAKAISGMVGNVGQSATGILNAIGQSSQSSTSAAASSAQSATGANAETANTETQGLETAAMVALMFA